MATPTRAGEQGAGADGRRATVGLLADPDAPAELAQNLADELPEALALRVADDALTAVSFLVDGRVLGSQPGHPAGATGYLDLAWPATSVAVVAGAAGSSLESDEAVRAAAYSRREQERPAHLAEAREADDDEAAAASGAGGRAG